jgi:hypothetical protein
MAYRPNQDSADYSAGYEDGFQAGRETQWASKQAAQRRAVIEAARVLFRGFTAEDATPDAWRTDGVLDYRLHDLFVTVEALDAAEKGGE